ncbi:hypothetical protein SteCoe_22143 [Stentor coeruleus]|uniref:Uncharacterized protein n=1 Tax=Stentor coeruleus TaxID=5963 RepID=A0A1R2BNH6_9CILI|nr:hypothetical protein SteCoe_22143 [Stentor coeruleus]
MLDTSHNFYNKIQSTRNCLIIKDDVGKSKPNTRTLPSTDFSYGMHISKDHENAGDVISAWAENIRKPKKILDQDFKKLNIMSIAKKQVTAPQQRLYRKTVICRRLSSEEPKYTFDNPDHVYGMPLRPSTPIKAVIGNFYGLQAIVDKHFAYSDKEKNPNRRRLFAETPKKSRFDEQKGLFKMKKFLKIRARTSTRRNHSFSG